MPGPDSTPAWLPSLLIKRGVSVGGLAPEHRLWVLGLVAARLAQGEPAVSEAEVNARLKACLAEEGACLATDHVELRRWLVDTGWWRRDGYGRAYERVRQADMRGELHPVSAALAGVDPAAWVALLRAQQAHQRESRRRAWQGGALSG